MDTDRLLTATWMTPDHRRFLISDAHAQFDFFDNSLRPDGGFYVLDATAAPLNSSIQELHTTTRLIHSYALGKLAGRQGCDAMIDHGMAYLMSHHHDRANGGYFWALDQSGAHDGRKLAYGHVFVMLAAASALAVDHPAAAALLDDVDRVLDQHFWEEHHGLFCDEFNADWTPFSVYRGMNANMHATEALLAAFEVTGRTKYLDRATRILDFFTGMIAPAQNWRIPEHYTDNWQIDHGYSGDPMFRPAGTTPGHSFELARLLLHLNELSPTPDPARVARARSLTYQALADAWDAENSGLFYTLRFDGTPDIRCKYWWPVTEAIGVLAALLKADPRPEDINWYTRIWAYAQKTFIDTTHGGWFPEVDDTGTPLSRQFQGKPDIYHAIQAVLFPMLPGVARTYATLPGVM
ncbi:AGE family epimerase/isomerase [Epibacterium sp. SM1979]|uniref:AGE family epimerase/isomerase n=1 Tax=Tritonibacter litoralis TaxID=2662264 RepID=A0A843YEX6_9RHOB|nr:AGE family epimerase/isomerase [Tritonibacter litoralis]MQQ09636.1 AGE family epimerase/isomerase [Tritonibacter litoralis]